MRVRPAQVLLPAAALTLSLGVTSCSDDSAGPEIGADVEDVAEPPGGDDEEPFEEDEALDPEEEDGVLVGETVTVSGEISEVLGPGAVMIGEGEDEVLVLSAPLESFEPLGLDVSEELVGGDAVLRVTGTVRQFLIEPFEETFGLDYDPETFAPFEGANVILAGAVSTLAGEDLVFAGEVEEVLGTSAFRIDGAGWTVVVLDAEDARVEPGDVVQVRGTVRRLDVEDLEAPPDDLLEDLDGELVVVADDVIPFAPVAP